jgi:hypothetical protein
MRSFLRKFQRLSAVKYPLKDFPEEEGNPAVPWRTCDFVSVGVSIDLTDYSAGMGHWEARSCCPGMVQSFFFLHLDPSRGVLSATFLMEKQRKDAKML